MSNAWHKRVGAPLTVLLGLALTACTQPNAEPNSVDLPQWAKGAVWYQIFPERFHNGSRENDPTSVEVFGTPVPEWQVTRWTSDWYARSAWEFARSDSFYNTVFDRRYGGDLVGVIDKLDYLADLGVTAIYLNPIFEARSLHKYDAAAYHHVDNNFGRDRTGDAAQLRAETSDPSTWAWTSADSVFLELIREAHARDIRVVIDGVWNHVGREFWAFQDLLKNGERSAYKDWFIVSRWDDPSTPEDEMEYKGWWDTRSLPEFREDDAGIVDGPRAHIWAVTRRWMDPNGDGDPSDGIDGWRLDVVKDVAKPFWRAWCSYARSINPNIYLSAELWEEADDYMSRDMFNSVMNYPFAYAMQSWFINTREHRARTTEFGAALDRIISIYDGDVLFGLMNLVDSHDTDRIASMIRNPNRRFDRDASPRYTDAYDPTRPQEREIRIQKMIATLQATFPGSPMIYYGDEAGMWGADDPDDRKPMLWPDRSYDLERYEAIAWDAAPDTVSFREDVHAHYRKVFRLRKTHPALREGSYSQLLADDGRSIFGFRRELGPDTVDAYYNMSERVYEILLQDGLTRPEDVLDSRIRKTDSGEWALFLPPLTAAVIVEKSDRRESETEAGGKR